MTITRSTTHVELTALVVAGAITTLEQHYPPAVAAAALNALCQAYQSDPIRDRVLVLLGYSKGETT